MIQIEEVRKIDPSILSPYSKKDWNSTDPFMREMVVKRSDKVWRVNEGKTPLIYVGVLHQSLVSPKFLWVLSCIGLRAKHVRHFPFNDLLAQFPEVETQVEEGFCASERFARYFGFHPTPTADAGYRLYKRIQ